MRSSSASQIFHNFLAVKDQPAAFIVDDLYVGTSGELYRRLDGLRPSLKSCNKEPGPRDLISQLPDEILLLILSRLTTEEAVKTCVLSTRWATLWWHTPKLEFCCIPKMVEGFCSIPRTVGRRLVNKEYSKFICRVNRVLQLHRAPALDEFCVRFDYRDIDVSSTTLGAWMYYALSKRVKRLELDFLNFPFHDIMHYWILLVYSYGRWFTKQYLDYCIDFSSLKEVVLKGLDVSSEVIECLLRKCCCLEQLTVIGYKALNSLVVTSSSLQYLNIILVEGNLSGWIQIRSCLNLRKLVLVNNGQVKLTDLPKLTELHVYALMISPRLSKGGFAGHLSQLEVLMLHSFDIQLILDLGIEVPELSKVKTLIINMAARIDESLIGLASLIAACPNLHKFKLQFCGVEPSITRRKVERNNLLLNLNPVQLKLKVVGVSGYYGHVCEDELIMYLLANAASVERLILDPRNSPLIIGAPQVQDFRKIKIARCHAHRLRKWVPNHVRVVIL